MKKKTKYAGWILMAALILAMTLALTACGGEKNEDGSRAAGTEPTAQAVLNPLDTAFDSGKPILAEKSPAILKPAPEDLVISEETVVRLKRIVQSLEGKYRDVLEMKILEELPDAAIAEELGIPKATMQTRLMRARRLVIEKWKEENEK